MRSGSIVCAAAIAVVLTCVEQLPAQPFQRGGAEFNAMREVTLPADKDFRVVVVEFLHHGQITPDGKNVVVATKDEKLVPSRVLQLGPGDFCRLAFETVSEKKNYAIFYGGDAANVTQPAWTRNDGLLLETRVYKDCNLNSFESVRDAFNASTRIGSDYVSSVSHASNPFSLKPEPFLSRYSGNLHVPSNGTYGFVISSQDCSFLVIDDKVVAAEPGAHPPRYQAPPGSRKDIELTAGTHKFEYYHAATGPAAMMLAAWEPSPPEAKPKPQAIPPETFHAAAIGRAEAGPVSLRTARLVPDFTFHIVGDVPLPDNPTPLVAVTFTDRSPPALITKSTLEWDFGDGQTAETTPPSHVYLHPGLYTVKLTVKRGGKPFETTNRIYVDRPFLAGHDAAKAPKLDDFLPILATYNPKRIDAAGLKQLVAAYQWKIDLLNASPPPKTAGPATEEPAKDSHKLREQEAARQVEIRKYAELAVIAGKAAFLEEDTAAQGDDDLYQLASLVGPLARIRLGDSLLAGHLWAGAVRRISKPELKVQCELEAADIAVNDLGNLKAAKAFLDAASTRISKEATGPLPSRLYRVWGDYFAADGKGEDARKAYLEAEVHLASTRNNTTRTAWQGAHSRSTEHFLRSNELDRAITEIRVWERDFPADKLDGYLTLLYARYWAAREMYPQAIALSEQLLAVNPASPYIDQLLLLAADCEVKRGQRDRALATLHTLLKEYPGSPLAPVVRKTVQTLESGELTPSKKPGTRPSGRKHVE